MTFAEELKQQSPLAFEAFRSNWLRHHFPFWNETGPPKIYFCEMDFKMQVVYFLEYLRTWPYWNYRYQEININKLEKLKREIEECFGFLEYIITTKEIK